MTESDSIQTPGAPLSAPLSAEDTQEIAASLAEPQGSASARLPKGVRMAMWGALFVFSFLVFTVAKLPSVRIKNYVQGSVAALLAQRGIGFTVEEGHISIGFGISYVMTGVTLSFPPPDEPVKIEKVEISPSLLSLLTGKMGASLDIRNGDGKFSLAFAGKSAGLTSASFSAKDFDIGKIGLLPLLAGFKGSALVSGSGSFKGDSGSLADSNGELDLEIKKLVVDPQNILGFAVPKLSVSEGKAQAQLGGGKLTLQALTLGKKGGADDVVADVSGDVTMAKQLDASALNLNARFSLSPNIVKAFPLVDSFIGQAKQSDGSYALKIAGTLGAPSMPQLLGGANAPPPPQPVGRGAPPANPPR